MYTEKSFFYNWQTLLGTKLGKHPLLLQSKKNKHTCETSVRNLSSCQWQGDIMQWSTSYIHCFEMGKNNQDTTFLLIVENLVINFFQCTNSNVVIPWLVDLYNSVSCVEVFPLNCKWFYTSNHKTFQNIKHHFNMFESFHFIEFTIILMFMMYADWLQ